MDSFPKMPKDYQQYSGIGGLVTVFMYMILVSLIFTEIFYFKTSRIYNKFVPDVDFNDKLKITVDITIATPCHDIGADIVDVTNQESRKFGNFNLKDTWFQLSPNQQTHFEEVRRLNNYLREKFHSLRDILWKAGYTSYYNFMPERSGKMHLPPDACRITGKLELNKVAGNFHITAGKSLSIPGGHIHLQQLFPIFAANFSHRIDKFFFGDPGPGIIHPLDSSIKITNNDSQVFKYFIEVVSTDVDTSKAKIKTYQYSVKELTKFLDENLDSHEMAGIYFKYDVNPLKVVIREEEYTIVQLILKITGCAGGLYIIAGLITNIFEFIVRYKYGEGAYVTGNFVSVTKDELQPTDSI